MSVALITALSTGIPAIIAAIVSLIMAIRNAKAITTANNAVNGHLQAHDILTDTARNAYDSAQQAIGLARSTNDAVQSLVDKMN